MPMEIGSIRREEVPRATALLREALAEDLSSWRGDISRAERVLRLLLSWNRLPLRILGVLGLRFEVWVAREDGEVLGVLGQFDGHPPILSGIAVAPGARRKGIAKALLRHAFADLERKGEELVLGTVRTENTPALKLCASVGMQPFGTVRIYSVPLPPRALPEIPQGVGVRRASKDDVARLKPTHVDRDSLRRLSRLNAAYAPWPLRLVGIRRSAIVAESDGELLGFVALQMGRYWEGGTVQAPVIARDEDRAFPALLSSAIAELVRHRVSQAFLVLPHELQRFSPLLVRMGSELVGEWVQLVRYLGKVHGA